MNGADFAGALAKVIGVYVVAGVLLVFALGFVVGHWVF